MTPLGCSEPNHLVSHEFHMEQPLITGSWVGSVE